ncbi:MAG: hypothetical protein ACPHID_01610 [Thermoplasmatota archaeon]
MKGASWVLVLLLAFSPVAAQPEGQGQDPDRGDARDGRASADDRRMQTRDDVGDGFDGRWVDFTRTPAGLTDFTVHEILIIEALTFSATFDELERKGNRVVFEGPDGRLTLSDSRTGHLAFQLPGGAELTFSEETTFTARGDHVEASGPGFRAFLKGNLDINGTTVTATELAFHVIPGDARSDRPEVAQAIEARRVAGEIRIRDTPEVLVYDDVDITVDESDDGLRVVFDAELDAGRTFVVDVDPSRLRGPDLQLRYFDVHEAGETEVVFSQASSLDDILDPDDDGGQPEYWVVRDADGLQVMVSVPHWSVHAITIQSIGAFVSQPSVLVGIAAGIGGVGVAALLLLRPRRDI